MKLRVLAAVTFALLVSAPAWAGDPDEPVKASQADLDGDGKPEAISLDAKEDGRFTLKAGAATVRGSASGNEVTGFTVVDLDSGDKWKEIAVHSVGASDDLHRILLYGFDGKSLKELGSVNAITEARGNGVVLADRWMGFWQRREKYALDRKAWKLNLVPQDLYYVGTEATVKQSFPLVRSRTDSAVVANTAPGSKVQVLAAAVTGNEPEAVWYLVKSSTGLLGWTHLKTLFDKTEGLPFAG
jgi:hypothetical protein